tara:strand:+ start:6832 stop:8391 length:1560 start_codon:yes stop_codon:yes gene_type:complete
MLSDKIRRCAEHYPHKVAYYQGDRSKTWEQVYTRAKALAGGLQAMGVKPGDCVAIVAKECIEVYEHFYACMLIGAVRVGVNWRYSPREMMHVISNSNVSVCIIQDGCLPLIEPILDKVSDKGCQLIGLGDNHGLSSDYDTIIEDDKPCDVVQVDDDAPLLITYTSGSTAEPKGVVLSHLAVETEIVVVQTYFCLGGGDVYYNPAQSAWVAVIGGIFGLASGLTTVIPHDLFEMNNYINDVKRRKVTSGLLVPAMMQRLLDLKDDITDELDSLKKVVYGSAPSTPTMIRAFNEAFGVDLIQLYGMTECCSWAAFLTPDDHHLAFEGEAQLLKSCGRFGSHVDFRICDEDGNEVPVGESGVLWLKGDNIMTEYINLPEETGEVLKSDGWLLTNDLGYVDENRYFYITDRKKSLINSGGVNIFPSMVEAIISEMPEIRMVSVVGIPHPQWGEAVTAAVEVYDTDADPEEIKKKVFEYCYANLSKLESPKHVEIMDAVPLTYSGKLDKNNLRKIIVENKLTDW